MALSLASKHSRPLSVATSACPKQASEERQRDINLELCHTTLLTTGTGKCAGECRHNAWWAGVILSLATATVLMMYVLVRHTVHACMQRGNEHWCPHHITSTYDCFLPCWETQYDCHSPTVTSAHHLLRSPSCPPHSGNSCGKR